MRHELLISSHHNSATKGTAHFCVPYVRLYFKIQRFLAVQGYSNLEEESLITMSTYFFKFKKFLQNYLLIASIASTIDSRSVYLELQAKSKSSPLLPKECLVLQGLFCDFKENRMILMEPSDMH